MDNINDYDYYVIKVADTPQELIQVGDLVKVYNQVIEIEEVYINTNGLKFYSDGGTIQFSEIGITKILTPNSRGGYDLQWEANND